METALRLVAGAVLVAANGFFVVTEFALTRLASLETGELGDDPRLDRARQMLEELEIYLTGCQLGISSTTILLGVITEPAVTALLRPFASSLGLSGQPLSAVSVVVAIVALNLVHKIWGEQAPTYLGVERPIAVARVTGPVHYWWTRALMPAILAGDRLAKLTLRAFGIEITRSWIDPGEGNGSMPLRELRKRLASTLRRGELSGDRRREVLRSLDIEAIPVSDIMVPRDDVVALSSREPFAGNLRTITDHGFVRFPVVGASLDEPIGVVYLPAILAALDDLESGEATLEGLASEAVRVAAETPISEVIDRLQEAGEELAFVTDGGRTRGIVTSTDAFEAIAGEMEDPLD